MNDKNLESFYEEDKEVNAMPSVELVECEKDAYINGMKEYLRKLKKVALSNPNKIREI